jgi:hypothetical protein
MRTVPFLLFTTMNKAENAMATRKLDICASSPVEALPRSLLLLGDVMIGRLVDAAVLPCPIPDEVEDGRSMTALGQQYRTQLFGPTREGLVDKDYYARLWGGTSELLQFSACNLINLECCATTHSSKYKPKRFNYRFHPDNVGALQFCPVHFACVANNHVRPVLLFL